MIARLFSFGALALVAVAATHAAAGSRPWTLHATTGAAAAPRPPAAAEKSIGMAGR